MNFQVEETIRARRSVRSYQNRPLSQADRAAVQTLLDEVCKAETPFPARLQMRLLEAKPGTDTEKLGTYGVIRGASAFVGVAVKNEETAMEAVGYSFEKFVLAATAMGLGTCWLAGTFNRDQFENAMELAEDDVFLIACPIGYPSKKKTLVNSVFRRVSGSDQRKPWDALFFDGVFGRPLSREAVGEYAFPLEMLRLAPSAANRQPWRIVRQDNSFHFYREAAAGNKYPYDLPRLDVGIGACHFHMAAMDHGLLGTFIRLSEPEVTAPGKVKYLFSWQMEKAQNEECSTSALSSP